MRVGKSKTHLTLPALTRGSPPSPPTSWAERALERCCSEMLAFLTQRLLQIIPTLILVSMLIFGLQQLLPGDPALIMAGEERDPKVLEEIRQQYRLNEPIPVQYFYWMKGVLSCNLGESMRLNSSVASLVAEKLPVTLHLAGMAIIVALGIGIPAGIISAVKKDTAWDYGANIFALWGISTPNFWLGILMIFLFSVTLGWLPASGYVRLAKTGAPASPPR